MFKNGKRWHWVLSGTDQGRTELLGVFSWVGSATGYVKHLTSNESRQWTSSEQGTLSVWTSVLADETDKLFVITPVPFQPWIKTKEEHGQ